MTNPMEDQIKFRKALKRMMASDDGKIVESALLRMFVEQTALVAGSQLETGYRLGQKEFVQGLLRDSKTDIEDITTINTGE